MFEVLVKLGPF